MLLLMHKSNRKGLYEQIKQFRVASQKVPDVFQSPFPLFPFLSQSTKEYLISQSPTVTFPSTHSFICSYDTALLASFEN